MVGYRMKERGFKEIINRKSYEKTEMKLEDRDERTS